MNGHGVSVLQCIAVSVVPGGDRQTAGIRILTKCKEWQITQD